MCKKRRKFMNQWVKLYMDNRIVNAKITNIEFHPGIKKPVFHMKSQYGNEFRLTRDELRYYECPTS